MSTAGAPSAGDSTPNDGAPRHLHVTTMHAGWPESLAAIAAMGLATVATGYGFAAIRSCAAAGCDTGS